MPPRTVSPSSGQFPYLKVKMMLRLRLSKWFATFQAADQKDNASSTRKRTQRRGRRSRGGSVSRGLAQAAGISSEALPLESRVMLAAQLGFDFTTIASDLSGTQRFFGPSGFSVGLV